MTPEKQKKNKIYIRSVAGKFAIAVSVISLFIGLLAAVSIAYIKINHEEKDRLRMIERIHLGSEKTLRDSLWMMNFEVVETVLAGISSIPGVEEVTLIADTGEVIKKGKTLSQKLLKHEHPLLYSFQGEKVSLGKISITFGLDHIFKQIYHDTKVLFFIIALISLIAGGGTVVVFHRLLGQHLKTIAEHSANLNFENLDMELSLKRRKTWDVPDELELIIKTFNHMQGRINQGVQEREKAAKLLQKSEKKYRTLFESMEQGVVYQNTAGAITSANPAAERILGLTINQMQGRTSIDPSWQTIHEDGSNFPGEDHPAMVALQCGESVKNVIMGVFSPEKESHNWINVTAIPQFNSGENKPYQVYTTLADITEYKKAEREKAKLESQLQQAQKMESIGTLAGGIAHDFNNILAAILGYAEMAKDGCLPGSTISKDINEVLEAGNRARSLVRQILAFSRQDDTERMVLQPASIVKETITMLRPSLPTTIEINQDIDTVTGLVFVDPTQLNQILMNLCTNAFHAMEETGGNLGISLKEVTLSNEDLVYEPDVTAGTFIQLSISDSGTGITPTVKDKIFDPYFTTKKTGKGTGMGLSMVHGIVKSYGGFISLYSELGEGTVFHVFLPTLEKDEIIENEMNDQIPIGRERILFVDDEEILTKMGKTMLERLGYHVSARNNSLEALETFQNQPDQFDIVITDQTMPGMTGSDLSKKMLQIRPDIPIILCTGYSTIISEEKAKHMGIKAFAFKPLAKKDIAKLIRKILDGS